MKKIFTLLLFSLFVNYISTAQSDKVHYFDEGTLDGRVYFCEEIGWSIEVPDDWPLMSLEVQKYYEQRGLDAMESIVDFDIDSSQLKNLISFQKDVFNSFSSTMEPVVLEYEGEYEEINEHLKELLQLTYKSQGIVTKVTETTQVIIDGISFETFEVSLHTPDGDLFLSQLMYSALINGFDFGVCISYNNETDKKAMLDAFKNSTFKNRETQSLSDLKILYIVNGEEKPESVLKELDPNDIQTVTVIKGKEQIANYTTEDYDGVIIVELKNK